MKCEYAEKVSQLIDGELSEVDAREIENHVAHCAECSALKTDFLLLRVELRESSSTKTYELPPLETKPIWKRSVSVPAPAFVVLLLAFLTTVSFLAYSYLGKDEVAVENKIKAPQRKEKPRSETTLERFDLGGRAEIYVVSENKVEVQQ